MTFNEKLLEEREYIGEGYSPVVDYGAWRVAILNYTDDLLPQNIADMQRHDETDEIFVLLRGRCILFVGAGEETATSVFAQDMEPLKVYNVKRTAWHTHTLSADAMVLIVENRDTNEANSPSCLLDEAQRKRIVDLTHMLWEDRMV
jgi:hypothetical protein